MGPKTFELAKLEKTNKITNESTTKEILDITSKG